MLRLRRWLASQLRALARWIDEPVPVVPLDALTQHAQVLIHEQETRWPERSGEAKRHQVYAALIDAFPGVSKRAISRAIEDAL